MFSATTIIAVRRDGKVAMAGDGQVTFKEAMVMKHHARKVRRIYHEQVLVGFAGAAADAFTLEEKFEGRLEEFGGNLPRAAVEVAREWRTDRALRQLQALMIAADARHLLVISGTGEVIEPDEPVTAIGSGGPYALAAATALLRHTTLDARAICEEALRIAARICVFTNEAVIVEEL